MKLKLLFIIPLMCLFTSCIFLGGIKGDGPVITKSIENLSLFTTIKVSKGLNVELSPGKENAAVIEANENLIEIIRVTVENNILHITSDKNIRSATKKKVFVTYNNLEKLVAKSGAYVTNKGNLKNKKLTIIVHSGAHAKLNTVSDHLKSEIHSGSKLDIVGFTNSSHLEAHSGASINAKNLKSKKAVALAHSGASIKIYASESFKGNAHSGASIRCHGNPKSISKKNSSGGSISVN